MSKDSNAIIGGSNIHLQKGQRRNILQCLDFEAVAEI